MPDNAPNAAPPSVSSEMSLALEGLRFLRVIQRRRNLVIFSLCLSFALAAVYYATAPRIYQSQGSLLVQQGSLETAGNGNDVMVKDLMDTYRGIVLSERVIGDAIKELPTESKIDLDGLSPEKWIKKVQDNLTVVVVRKTNILQVTYRSRSPEAAAAVVRNVLDSYLAFMDKHHKSTARDMLDILTQRKSTLESDLAAKENSLLQLKQRIGDVVVREGESHVSMQAKTLQGEFELLRKAEESRLEAESQWRALREAIDNGRDLHQFASMFSTTNGNNAELEKRLGPDSATLSRIREQLLQDYTQLRSDQERYGPNHSRVRQLQEKIHLAESFLKSADQGLGVQALSANRDDLARMLTDLAVQRLSAASAYESMVRQSVDAKKADTMKIQGNMAQLENLDRELNRMYKSLDLITEQIKNIEIGKDNTLLGTAVLSSPEIATKPVSPSLKVALLVALALGLGGGMSLAYITDMLDDRFGSVDELKQQVGGIPMLAVVRKLDPLDEVGLKSVYSFSRPTDPATEAFRTLRTALTLVGEGVKTITVSSAEAGDGKTTVSTNLMIDADIRRPRMTPLMELRGYPGLTNVLRQTTPLDPAAVGSLIVPLCPGLDILPAGPRATNPAELLTSDRLPEVLAWAESKYDYVLVDSPPSFVSDVAIIGRLADGLVLVVRPDKNRRRVLLRAVENLATMGVNLFGLVLNQYTATTDKYGYDYEYRYEYSYSYGHDESESPERPDGDDDDPTESVPMLRRTA
jgi:succinoglycan biosynthesis transport protein ExoP